MVLGHWNHQLDLGTTFELAQPFLEEPLILVGRLQADPVAILLVPAPRCRGVN